MSVLKKGCLTVVIAFVAVILIGIGVFWFVHRPLHKPSFNAEIVVDLVVDGEPVRLRRIVECATVDVSTGDIAARFGRRRPTEYAPTVGAIGQRLKDGGAIVMWTPYRCAHKEIRSGSGEIARRVIPNEPGYIPFMGWTPNADTFDVLELYPAASYFDKPDARIKFTNLVVRDAPPRAHADPPDEFEWFTQKATREESRKRYAAFSGVNALVLKKGDWAGKDPVIDSVLAAQKSLFVIGEDRNMPSAKAGQRMKQLFRERYSLRRSANYPSPQLPEQYRIHRKIAQSIASPLDGSAVLNSIVLKRNAEGDVLVSIDGLTSIVRLRRISQSSKGQSSSIIWAKWRLGSHVVSPSPKHADSLLYDPLSGDVYWMFNVYYAGRARK